MIKFTSHNNRTYTTMLMVDTSPRNQLAIGIAHIGDCGNKRKVKPANETPVEFPASENQWNVWRCTRQ